MRARNSRFSLGRPPRTAASTSSAGSSGWLAGTVGQTNSARGRLTASVIWMCLAAARTGTLDGGTDHIGPRGRGPKYFSIHFRACVGSKVARDAEDRVVRDVVGAEERRHVGQPRGRQVGHRADDAVVIRMIGRIERFQQPFFGLAVRYVVDRLPPLVLDHVALVVELLLRHRRQQKAHPIGLEPERQLECIAGDGLVIHRLVFGRRAVQVGAELFQRQEVIVVVVLRALEHHVLEQVGKAGSTRLFVLRADLVHDVHGDDRRLVVLVKQDRQAVRKGVFLDFEQGNLGLPDPGPLGLVGCDCRRASSQNHANEAETGRQVRRASHEFDPSPDGLRPQALPPGANPTGLVNGNARYCAAVRVGDGI